MEQKEVSKANLQPIKISLPLRECKLDDMNQEQEEDTSQVVPRMIQNNSGSSQDNSATVIHEVELSLSNILSSRDRNILNDTNFTRYCDPGHQTNNLNNQNTTLSNIQLMKDLVNNISSSNTDTFYNNKSLTCDLSTRENLLVTSKLNEDGHNGNSSNVDSLKLSRDTQLKPITRDVLQSCMKKATYAMEVKECRSMEKTNRSISLRRRSHTAEFSYRDADDSSSNVSDEDHCSDWELDFSNSNHSDTSFTQYKQRLLVAKQANVTTQKLGCEISTTKKVPSRNAQVSTRSSESGRTNDVASEKHLISQPTLFSAINNKLQPYIYEKDLETGSYLISKKNSTTNAAIMQRFLDKSVSIIDKWLEQNPGIN